MKKVLNKIHSKKAFSMAEMLVATLILGLMTTALAAGISASLRVYGESVTYSEERMLLSTLSEVIVSELRHAKEVSIKDNTLDTYTSRIYGFKVSFVQSDGKIKVNSQKNGTSDLVGDGSYSKANGAVKLYAKLVYGEEDSSGKLNGTGTEGIKYDATNGRFDAWLKVWTTDEENAELKHIVVTPLETVDTTASTQTTTS